MSDRSWFNQAACLGADTDAFFPDSDNRRDGAAAVRFCKNTCPYWVRTACLEWALKHDERGIWGGTNDAERKTIKRRRNRRQGVAA